MRRFARCVDALNPVFRAHARPSHIDYLGLAEIVVQCSGVKVGALGIPERVTVALRSVSRSFRGWVHMSALPYPLEDGQHLPFPDRTLQAIHRPGHSPSDTVFWDEERKILIAAEH